MAIVYDTELHDYNAGKNIFKNTNRYLDICGKLYPIYIIGVDDVFTGPIDSASLRFNSRYSRQLFFNFSNQLLVDVDKSVFYKNYFDSSGFFLDSIPHGHIEYLEYKQE